MCVVLNKDFFWIETSYILFIPSRGRPPAPILLTFEILYIRYLYQYTISFLGLFTFSNLYFFPSILFILS